MRTSTVTRPVDRPGVLYGHCAHPEQLAGLQPYRGADHREPYPGDHLNPPRDGCHHPTPPPRGTRRCTGDPGCGFRIPTGHTPVCLFHDDRYWSMPGDDYWQRLATQRHTHIPELAEL